MNNAKMYILASLRTAGWPSEMIDILVYRCGGTSEDWKYLVKEAMVEERDGRFVLTKHGKTTFKNNRSKFRSV